MRLFIGVPVSAEVKEAVAALIAKFKECGADVKWTDPENLHLTLRFLGETPEKSVPTIQETMLRAAAGKRRFEAAFGGAGSFGSRVLWVGLCSGADRVSELAAALGPQEREYAAHLTIGRVRGEGKLPDLSGAPKKLGRTLVDRIVLYESRLSSAGPKYSSLAEVSLAA